MTLPLSPAELLTLARSWEGTPYHPHGRIKGIGVDCAMFLAEVFYTAGWIPHIDPGYYPVDFHLHRDEEQFMGWVARFAKAVSSPAPADIALFRTGRAFGHGGIVFAWSEIGPQLLIHARTGVGVLCEDVRETFLVRRDVCFFRFRQA